MKTIGVVVMVCAMGAAALASFASAADMSASKPQRNVVPVSVVPIAAAASSELQRERVMSIRESPPRDPALTQQPSSLDRELGTASDGGYHYYESDRR